MGTSILNAHSAMLVPVSPLGVQNQSTGHHLKPTISLRSSETPTRCSLLFLKDTWAKSSLKVRHAAHTHQQIINILILRHNNNYSQETRQSLGRLAACSGLYSVFYILCWWLWVGWSLASLYQGQKKMCFLTLKWKIKHLSSANGNKSLSWSKRQIVKEVRNELWHVYQKPKI